MGLPAKVWHQILWRDLESFVTLHEIAHFPDTGIARAYSTEQYITDNSSMKKHTPHKTIIRIAAVILASVGLHLQTSAAPADSVAGPRPRPGAPRLMAEEILKDMRPAFIGGNGEEQASPDSIKSLLEIFYMNQYRQFHDPQAPYFMFLTKDAKVAMGIGGKIMLRAWYDWHGTVPSYAFYPAEIPVPENPAARKGVSASPSQSQLFMTLLGHSDRIGDYMVYVDAGLEGRSFLLRDAYLRLHDFTVGFTRSTFWDPAAYAPGADGQGPNGQISYRSMLVRYFHTFRSGWSVAGSLEFPSSHPDVAEGVTEKCPDYVPDVVALGQYAWDGGSSYVRASAMLRVLPYRNLLTSSNHSVTGWGAQISGRWRPVVPLTVYYQGALGRGIGSYLGDLSTGDYDLIGDPDAPGRMTAPLAWGVTAGLQYDFSRRFFVAACFGDCRYYNDTPEPSEYKYGLYGAADFFWNITPRLQSAIEYLIGSRKNFDGRSAWTNRLQLMLAFSF